VYRLVLVINLLPASLLCQQLDAQTLTARVEFAIPGEGDNYYLTTVGGIAVLDNGYIAVLQPLDKVLRVFDSTGRYTRTVGGPGAGPGEFTRPWLIGTHGDSLWVWDRALGRMSIFGPEWRFARSLLVPTPGQGVLLADGSVVALPIPRYSAYPVEHRPAVVGRLGIGGRLLDTLFIASVEYHVLSYPYQGRFVVGRQPFDDGPLLTFAADGTSFVHVERAARAGATRRTFSVTRITENGDTLYSAAYPYDPIPIGRRDIEVAVEYLHRSGPQDRARERRIREALYIPDHHPTVTRVLVGTDGVAWLRREVSEAETVRWTVLDPAGQAIYSVALPANAEVLSAARHVAWGVVLDEQDVPSIVRFRVDRTERARPR